VSQICDSVRHRRGDPIAAWVAAPERYQRSAYES